MDCADDLGVNFVIIALITLIKSLEVESYLWKANSSGLVDFVGSVADVLIELVSSRNF